MTIIFPKMDNNLIYTLLNNNQDTPDLVRMRRISRKWREIVDYISRNMLLTLGVRVDREGAAIHLIQITACFNRILRPELNVKHTDKIREAIPHLTTMTQIKLIREVFMTKDTASASTEKFNAIFFREFMEDALGKLSDSNVPQTFTTALINQSRDIVSAAKFNSQESFFYIYNNYKPSQDAYQEALLPACQAGNFTLIHTVIDLGADPTKQHTQTESYLIACCKSKCTKGVRLLVTMGADTKRRDEFGATPIAIAAKVNKKMFDIFSRITEDLNVKFGAGIDKTLAHFAAEGNNFEVIRFLHGKGIDIDQTDAREVTPLMIAIRARATKTVETLLACGASIHKKCVTKSLAHFAAEGNNPDAIWLLLSHGISVDDRNIHGRTPLMISIRESSTDTFYRLLECNASLSNKCGAGLTPLDYAVMRGKDLYIEVLLERIQDKKILLGACATAVSCKNTRALNMITKALGVSTPIKYGLVLSIGVLAGGFFAMKYFGNGE